jgi:FlaA1/EpsC-like NDP-sugar epimerase
MRRAATAGKLANGGTDALGALRRVRGDLPFFLLDALLTILAYFGALVLRFDGAVPDRYWLNFGTFVGVAVFAHLASNWAWGLYGQMWRHASVTEARRVVLSAITATAVLFALFWSLRLVPRSVIALGGAGSMMLLGALRFHSRLFAFKRNPDARIGLRVAVVGAGESGAVIVREMLRNPAAGFTPVVVLDDDVRKQGRSLAGVSVSGGIDRLADEVIRLAVHQVVLAIPSAGPELVRRVAAQAEVAGVALKVLPSVKELIGGRVSVQDVRDLRIEDLLGRQQVETDLEGVRRLLHGRTVLITGAGGSIGAEITRQVAECAPGRLVLLDHDETHLHDAAAALDTDVVQVLADIRDRRLVDEVMAEHRPEVIFHAAAHKHVPLLEQHPCEAVRTNVIGTHNVVASAVAHAVERLVFISTDKAVEPSSVMGASKRLSEQIVTAKAPPGARYCAVRFGNVVGSRGSVIPTFARQISAGGPVTVTDPRMTRFFMSVQEAVQLVLQAAAFAEGGEVFMLDMGEPVNILELAERMIRLSGRNVGTEIPVRIVGARPGEKITEQLRAPGEEPHPTPHPSIVRLYPQQVSELAVDAGVSWLAALAEQRRGAEAARLLFTLARQERDGVLDLTTLERSVTWSPSTT